MRRRKGSGGEGRHWRRGWKAEEGAKMRRTRACDVEVRKEVSSVRKGRGGSGGGGAVGEDKDGEDEHDQEGKRVDQRGHMRNQIRPDIKIGSRLIGEINPTSELYPTCLHRNPICVNYSHLICLLMCAELIELIHLLLFTEIWLLLWSRPPLYRPSSSPSPPLRSSLAAAPSLGHPLSLALHPLPPHPSCLLPPLSLLSSRVPHSNRHHLLILVAPQPPFHLLPFQPPSSSSLTPPPSSSVKKKKKKLREK